MKQSPYLNKAMSEWSTITEGLITAHHLKSQDIVDVVLQSWNEIFKSKIGPLKIGKQIKPSPQVMSAILHELVPYYLGKKYPCIYRTGTQSNEKDIHCITDASLSIEVKASSNPNKIFGNRSYAQPQTGTEKKTKDGYYITINFESFSVSKDRLPDITLIRFGYLEHTDWKGQKAGTGQQASLSTDAYTHKLKVIYRKA